MIYTVRFLEFMRRDWHEVASPKATKDKAKAEEARVLWEEQGPHFRVELKVLEEL